MKLGGELRSYSKNVSPRDLTLEISIAREFRDEIKRDGVFSRTQEIEIERASDSRGFRTGLEAQESLQRALRNVAIKCIKIETKIHHKKHMRDRIGLIQKPRGHKEDGASFPNQIQYKVSQIHGQILL